MGGREPLELVRDFLNTLDLETFGEHAAKPAHERDGLRSARELRNWLVERRLLEPRARVTDADREDAVALRSALRALLRARQGIASKEERRLLRADGGPTRALALQVDLLDDGAARLTPASGGVSGALARILAEVAVGAENGTLARLKVCSASDCQFVFYDHSRSRTARWCSMETCGNRVKTRRYRHRHRA